VEGQREKEVLNHVTALNRKEVYCLVSVAKWDLNVCLRLDGGIGKGSLWSVKESGKRDCGIKAGGSAGEAYEKILSKERALVTKKLSLFRRLDEGDLRPARSVVVAHRKRDAISEEKRSKSRALK